ncbi:hypothetical protein GIB67_001731 [Kingdonia uniflora]|uniref:RING-type domain-containing protein n=1 Tax=Kingdonia uniflora TaxID=39325 RepID=A0A7J7LMR9_9MAGN|nr:hypothetical protein GIB67_001731 [Kingdonia uniflora]
MLFPSPTAQPQCLSSSSKALEIPDHREVALCSVCLGDYQAEDKLQLIPMCGHSFHMDCIGSWLSSHSTCPLCRLSLIPAAKTENQAPLGNTEIEERAPQDSIETEESQNSVVEDDHRHCRETDDSFDIEAVGASSAEQEKNMRDHS